MIGIAAGLTAETMIVALAGFAWFLSRGYTFAEACAAGILSMFMILSLSHQLSFYFGSPVLGLVVEAGTLLVALFFGYRRMPHLLKTLCSVAGFFRQETFPGLIISMSWLVMAIRIASGWVSMTPLPAVFSRQGGGLSTIPLSQLAATQPVPFLNATALFNHTARFGLSPNSCGFGLLGVMAVGFSTYALARRYSWPPMALTVTLLVLSMPRLIALGGAPTEELLFTTLVCFSMVLIYRLVEQHRIMDVYLFILCICFTIGTHPLSFALAPVLVGLLVVVMIRRHGWLIGRELMAGNTWACAPLLIPALMLAQLPAFALNWVNKNPLFGPPIDFQKDGIFGAFANLIRYFYSSIDPTEPFQKAIAWLAGLDLNASLTRSYHVLVSPLPGTVGEKYPFSLIFSGDGGVGFGPFVGLFVLPSMAYALIRGTRRLKATIVAWVGYLYIASLVAAWHPDSIATLTPFWAANGFVVAFSLPPWRLRRRGLRTMQCALALLMGWSLWRFF